LIADLFRREGLIHRRCVLDIHPAAMARIVEQGYHPQLGARALKRAIERQLTGPIAARLAAVAPEAPMVISIYPSGEGIAPHVQPLMNVEPILPGDFERLAGDMEGALERVEDFVNLIEERSGEDSGPRAASRVSADALSAAHFRYFAVREQIQRIDRLIQQIDQANRRGANVLRRGPRVKAPRRIHRISRGADGLAPLPSARDVHARLGELLENAIALGDDPADRLAMLYEDCALLDAMAGDGVDRVLICLRPLGSAGAALVGRIRDAYLHLFFQAHGFAATALACGDDNSEFLLLEMPGIGRILQGETGTHLLYPPNENVVPMQVLVTPLREGEDAAEAIGAQAAARRRWREEVAAGLTQPQSDPHPLGPVVRVYDPAVATLDLRTALLCPEMAGADDLRRFILAGLPLPELLTVNS
jgi:ATP-dependent Clp protease ATP-binding subunit ClpC